MKMAKFALSILLVFLGQSFATIFINLEQDLRGSYNSSSDPEWSGEINSLGGSLRKVFSGDKGDRVILYAQAEAAHNLSQILVHQVYAQVKGPMGKWNVSLGRIPLPWGLLTEWSPDRMPYKSPYKATVLHGSDNGVSVSGVLGMFDYGVAVTQGFGMGDIESFPGHGVVTTRLGLMPNYSSDFALGVSFTTGTSLVSAEGHGAGETHEEKRTAAALDATAYLGRGVYRLETGVKKLDDHWQPNIFATVEYTVLPKLTLMGTGQVYAQNFDHAYGSAYAGVSVPLKALTIRGGYEYEKGKEENVHKASIQLYRSFSTSR